MIRSRSSGSSGKFVDLFYHADSFIIQELHVLRMIKDLYPEYCPTDKELLVYTSEYPFSSIFGFYKVIYVNNLSIADTILNTIQAVNPSVIAIYPSVLRELLDKSDNKLSCEKLKLILTNSEQSSQLERDHFANICGCTVLDKYSSEELQSIAYQCRNYQYHLVQDCSYIEILSPNSDKKLNMGEDGEVVGTNLTNFAMPLIRYRQQDLASLNDSVCSCGKTAPIMSSISGRINSSFKRADGLIIPSGKILDWTYSLVLSMNLGIREFEIVQQTLNDIVVNIVVTGNFKINQDERIIIDSFRMMFGNDYHVSVHIVSSIPRQKTGKHIPIKSLV